MIAQGMLGACTLRLPVLFLPGDNAARWAHFKDRHHLEGNNLTTLLKSFCIAQQLWGLLT